MTQKEAALLSETVLTEDAELGRPQAKSLWGSDKEVLGPGQGCWGQSPNADLGEFWC